VKRALSLGIVSSVLCLSVVAHADPAFTLEKPQVGLGVNYGIWSGDDFGDSDFNPYGIGFSAFGGYTLPMGLYLGGDIDYFLGDSEGDSTLNIYQVMFEGGYDIGLGPTAVIRPQLGIGYTTYHAELCFDFTAIGGGEDCQDSSSSDLGIAPGARFLMDFGGVFGQAHVRYNHPFSDGNADGILLGLGAGMTF
jgi:hypothetical protein